MNQRENSISVLAMPFKGLSLILVLVFAFFGFSTLVFATNLIEATVASVEDEVITLGELSERYESMKKRFPDITLQEVLDAIINRSLLLREARLLRIAGIRGLVPPTEEDKIIDEYIEIRIRSAVRVSEEEVRQYYESHRSDFKDRPFQDVAGQIEELLIERKTNELLVEHLEELRKEAYIVINEELLRPY